MMRVSRRELRDRVQIHGRAFGHLACVVLIAATSACADERTDERRTTSGTQPNGSPVVLASRAADTQHVQGQGIPTPPDDTLGTRYGKHEGPSRELTAPDCRPAGFALCLIDTARTAVSHADEPEGGILDERVTDWLVFAAARDSMQLFVAGPLERYLWMAPASAHGFVAEHAINDASWIRARFGHDGAYVFSARIASDTALSYELRVAPVIATGATWPTGRSATLQVRAAGRVAIVPAAMASGVESDSAWQRFSVAPGEYRALLVRDTLYVACALPCRHPRRFTMHPAQRVTVAP